MLNYRPKSKFVYLKRKAIWQSNEVVFHQKWKISNGAVSKLTCSMTSLVCYFGSLFCSALVTLLGLFVEFFFVIIFIS